MARLDFLFIRRVRPLASNAGARLGAIAALAIATVLIAHDGGPAEVGAYALLRVLPGLAGVLATFGLPGAMSYFLAQEPRSGRNLAPTMLAVTVGAGCWGTTLWFVGSGVLRGTFFPQLTFGLVAVAGITVATQPFVAVGKAGLQGLGDLGGANLAIFCEEAVFLPLYLGLGAVGVHGYASIVIALILADVVVGGGVWARLYSRGFHCLSGRPQLATARELASFGMRGQIGGLVSLVNLRLDFTILGAIAGPAALGTYAVASKYAELLRLPALAAGWVLYPKYARTGWARSTAHVQRLLPQALVGTVAAAIPMALAATWLLPTVYGHAFRPAVTPALILIGGLCGEGVVAVITAWLFGMGRPGLSSLATGSGLAMTVLLDIALIPRFGAPGAALASGVSYLTVCVTLLIMFRRASRSALSIAAPVEIEVLQ